jgi:hypothetical protein
MAEKSAPGMEFANYWSRFIPQPSQKSDVIGKMVAGFLGGLETGGAEGAMGAKGLEAVAPPQVDYMPSTQFPEVFNQQYSSPYAPAYTPQPVAPPFGPTSLQGFVAPPQYSAPTQAGVPALPGLKLPTLGATTQPQNQFHDLTNSIWSK